MKKIDTKKKKIIIGIALYIVFLIVMNINYFMGFMSESSKGPKSQVLYMILSIIVSIVVGALILFVNKRKKMKPEKVFVILAFILGFIYMFATPLLRGHDEAYHWWKAYAISRGDFLQEDNEKGNSGNYLPAKVEGLFKERGWYTEIDYKSSIKTWDYANDETISNDTVFVENVSTEAYPPLQMVPQVIGIIIGRTLGFNVYVQGMFGRFTNLLFYIIMGYFAIKYLPTKKYFLVALLLCPKMLYISATLSGDVFTNMVTILFTSYIFKLRKQKQLLTKKDIAIITILVPCIAISKLVYFAICGVVLLIPKECFKTKKQRVLFVGMIILLTMISVISWMKIANLTERAEKPEAQKEWIFSHPISYIGVLIRSVCANSIWWATDMVGGVMEWHYVLREPEIISAIVYVILLMALLKDKEKEDYSAFEFAIIGMIALVVMAVIMTALYLEWTSSVEIGGTLVTGVQGRYFTPIALLLTTLVPIKYLEIKKKIEAKWIYIIMILCQLPSWLNMFVYYI